MAMLDVNHLNISFGGLHAVDDFRFLLKKESFTVLLDLMELEKRRFSIF